jgi:Domain of unknown function (DUF4252)
MKRHAICLSLALLLIAVAANPAAAQDTLGVYPVEDLGILDPATLEVDVNLSGSTLKIAAGAMQDQDSRLLKLVSNLTRVRVQVGSVEGMDQRIVADRIGEAVAQLEAKGWVSVIRIETDGEQIYVFSIDGSGGNIAGLTALVNDGGDEAVVANLAGDIDPVLLGSMLSHLGEMDFDQFILGNDDD